MEIKINTTCEEKERVFDFMKTFCKENFQDFKLNVGGLEFDWKKMSRMQEGDNKGLGKVARRESQREIY